MRALMWLIMVKNGVKDPGWMLERARDWSAGRTRRVFVLSTGYNGRKQRAFHHSTHGYDTRVDFPKERWSSKTQQAALSEAASSEMKKECHHPPQPGLETRYLIKHKSILRTWVSVLSSNEALYLWTRCLIIFYIHRVICLWNQPLQHIKRCRRQSVSKNNHQNKCN